MIYSISGIIQSVEDHAIVLQVGRMCWCISVVHPSAYKTGDETLFYIYLHWNAETGPALFGFSNQLDQSVFSIIISCAGLGPKIGLAALEKLGAATFIQAIETSNISLLNRIHGVGTRKAEQMVLQLKHKIAQIPTQKLQAHGIVTHISRLHEVLESLHYSSPEVTAALQHIQSQYSADQQPSFEQLVRQALSFLSKQP